MSKNFCRDSCSESRQEFRFPPRIFARFPARSCEIFVARNLLLGEDLVEIRVSNHGESLAAGDLPSRKNLGDIRGRISVRFFRFPAGLKITAAKRV